MWSRKRRGKLPILSLDVDQIDKELNSNYIAIDCAGWCFSSQQRYCTAIEINSLSSMFWPNIYYEYDYLTWHPDYLPNDIILAYFSSNFKYCDLNTLIIFLKTWTKFHPKLIIGLDPTKILYNYFKRSLISVLTEKLPELNFKVLSQENFRLLFIVKSK